MKHTTTILLIAVCALLVGVLWFDDSSQPTKFFGTLQDNEARKEINILFWGTPIDNPAMKFFQEGCNDFMAKNPSIKVEIEYYSTEQYKSKLPVLMAANQTPDIFMTWCGAFLENFVKAGKVAPLNSYINESPEWKSTFPRNGFDLLTYDKDVYGVPTVHVFALLFYNKQVFSRLNIDPPTTNSELLAISRILRKHHYIPIAFGNKEPWVGGMLAGLIQERLAGKDLLAEVRSGNATWLDQTFLDTGNTLQQWVELGVFPENPNSIDYQTTIDLFQDGKAAMLVMGSWYLQYYLSHADDVDFALGVTSFPHFSKDNLMSRRLMGQPDMNLAIGAHSKEKEASFELIKFLTTPANQYKLMTEVGLMPAINVPEDTLDLPAEVLTLNKMLKESEALFIFPDIGLGGQTGLEFNHSIQRLIAGEDVTTTFQQLQTQWLNERGNR
ncbi:MAG: extracellular solute-binding protein [Desulfobulbaceae bacterium]|nr:MAG: extracellular solute-binding protein [Desulfobulbaceae bacterium]